MNYTEWGYLKVGDLGVYSPTISGNTKCWFVPENRVIYSPKTSSILFPSTSSDYTYLDAFEFNGLLAEVIDPLRAITYAPQLRMFTRHISVRKL